MSSVIYAVFSLWDFLSMRFVYVTLYCTIGVHILSFPMLLALTNKTRSSSSSIIPSNDDKNILIVPSNFVGLPSGERGIENVRAEITSTSLNVSVGAFPAFNNIVVPFDVEQGGDETDNHDTRNSQSCLSSSTIVREIAS